MKKDAKMDMRPKAGLVREKPAASGGGSEVGNEKQANMKGALGEAVRDLKRQHGEKR